MNMKNIELEILKNRLAVIEAKGKTAERGVTAKLRRKIRNMER
jgi:hypothetical protein